MDVDLADISIGIKLFNENEYFAAHDFFEDIWTDCHNESRLFFQGLIQISVGFYHLVCGNYTGSLSQLNKGVQKLSEYPKTYFNINIEKLLIDVKVFIEILKRKNNDLRFELDLIQLPLIESKFC